MRLWQTLRSLFGRQSNRTESDDDTTSSERMAEATASLRELRGDRVTFQPPESGSTSDDNVAAAVKDYGLSRLTGETDALVNATGSYRASKSRRQRQRDN